MTDESDKLPQEVIDALTFNPMNMLFRKETESATDLLKLVFTYKMGDSNIVNVFNESDDAFKHNIIAHQGKAAWFEWCKNEARRKVTAVLKKKLERLEADFREGLIDLSDDSGDIPEDGIVDYN